MNKQTIYLVAKRDGVNFTISDEDGYELSITLNEGSRVKICELVAEDREEIWFKPMREDEAPYYVLADDFSVIAERRA